MSMISGSLVEVHDSWINIGLHMVQFATLQQRCMEVAIIGCNSNAVATLLQHDIFHSIFGYMRCNLQRCSNVALRLQE